MEVNKDPQDSVQGFKVRMHKLLESFLSQCEQFDSMILDELQEAEKKMTAINSEIQKQKSQQQLNMLELSKLKDLQTKIDMKQGKIQELKGFFSQIQQFQNDQVQSLERYLVQAHKSHPLVKIDNQQLPSVSIQPNSDPSLVQLLNLQIQDHRIQIKNLELDVQMKGVYQQQLNDLVERYSKLELTHFKLQADFDQQVQESKKLEESNQTLQLVNKILSAEQDKLVKVPQNKGAQDDTQNFQQVKKQNFTNSKDLKQKQMSPKSNQLIKQNCLNCNKELYANDIQYCRLCSQKPICKQCNIPFVDPKKDCTYCQQVKLCIDCHLNQVDNGEVFCKACAAEQCLVSSASNQHKAELKQCPKCYYKGSSFFKKNKSGEYVCPYGCKF